MGLGDVFKATENKKLVEELATSKAENQKLVEKISELQEQITPELLTSVQKTIKELTVEKESLQNSVAELNIKYRQADIEYQKLRSLIDGATTMYEYGLYAPKYDFETSEEYAVQLEAIKNKEKEMIAGGKAAECHTKWEVSGSREKGMKMERDTIKLLLRAFNNECDGYIRKVSHSNIETTENHIQSSYNVITRLAKVNDITINESYLELKKQELYLAYEYACKKQEEKEAAKEERARLREEAKLLKEIEEERRKIEKEQTHYQNALEKLTSQIEQNPNDPELLAKKQELEQHIADTNLALQDVDYRAANKRAGYVYVISNIGAFGEGVYKIGMTRRLDPMERVDELGDASVPFDFDVHAMIFTDDAPGLEAALHKAFEDKKVNMVNPRREFFRVSLDEIKSVVKENFDKTVEFVDYPEADQYRASMQIINGTLLKI